MAVVMGPIAPMQNAATSPTPDLFDSVRVPRELRPSRSPRRDHALAETPHRAKVAGCPAIMACEDNISFANKLPASAIQLVVTSPPYNIGKAYERRSRLDHYLADQEKVIAACVRVLSPRGSLCWQVGNYVQDGEIIPVDTLLYPIFRSHGLRLRNRVIWHFEHGLHCSKRLSGRYERLTRNGSGIV